MSKKSKKVVHRGMLHINATFNNTIITVTDLQGNALKFNTPGAESFKGPRKGTPFAAQVAGRALAEQVRDLYGMREVEVKVKGPGLGREPVMKAFSDFMKILKITDITPVPFNGCRKPKERRV